MDVGALWTAFLVNFVAAYCKAGKLSRRSKGCNHIEVVVVKVAHFAAVLVIFISIMVENGASFSLYLSSRVFFLPTIFERKIKFLQVADLLSFNLEIKIQIDAPI